jgi:mRNA-degrading endonuclease toxin of MazEF toxin-antitoxin module
MPLSNDVLRLVRNVERLPSEDQDKILRLVDLLTLVPVTVQDRTQQMLRELLAREPGTKQECVAGVDEVIAYLERHAALLPRSPDGSRRHFGTLAPAKKWFS